MFLPTLSLSAVLATLIAVRAEPIPVYSSSVADVKHELKRTPFALKDSIAVPRQWKNVGRGPGEHVVELKIGLKQRGFGELERRLFEVSDPTHEAYGSHLSDSEIHSLVSPSDETLSLVHSWLSTSSIPTSSLRYSPAKDWITVSLPIAQIEALLDTEYSVFEKTADDGNEGLRIVRAPAWSLPIELHEHIDTIQPTTSFFRPTAMKQTVHPPTRLGPNVELHREYFSNPTVGAVCNTSGVTPLCLRTLYGTISYEPRAAGANKVGLCDYLGESNNRSDIEIYLQRYRPEAVKAAYEFQFDVIDGGADYQVLNETQLEAETDVEGNLDAETIIGIDWPTPLTAYTTGGSPPFNPDDFTASDTNEPYLAWVNYVLSQPSSDVPQTISTSYGDDEQTVPEAYARRVCNEFAQLGAKGVSLIFSSGDYGVGADGHCFSNDGKNTSMFLPAFPASCPYVTAVGATYQFNPEVAAYDGRFRTPFTSGGGFSNYFSRPAYQNGVVPAYVAGLDGEFSEFYNAKGRAYPDVAAQGVNFTTIWNGSLVLVDGTSAAAPTFAGVISLVNDALIAAGRRPLGFLNPWLYGGGYKAFTDVTSGSSAGCAGLGSGMGFPAKSGWDAVTGFGTPYFPKIIESLGLNCKWGHGGGWGGYWH